MQEMELQFHIKCKEGDVGKYVILPGDPGRCEKIAQYFDDAKQVSYNREYNIYTGTLNGEKVSVCSTGIGGPSAAIAMEELCKIGADTFIRIGTCGGMALDVEADDVVVASGAIRFEHTSQEYAPLEFPAVPDTKMAMELYNSSCKLGYKTHIGVVQCKDSFYGQHSPKTMPVANSLLEKWDAWLKLGVLASEMESAALFVVAAARKVRCASLFQVIWNQERENAGLDNKIVEDTTKPIKVAIEALKNIIEQDKANK